jgi:hypothetical protein
MAIRHPGGKDRLPGGAARVVASQVDLTAALCRERALLLAMALQYLVALEGQRGWSPNCLSCRSAAREASARS